MGHGATRRASPGAPRAPDGTGGDPRGTGEPPRGARGPGRGDRRRAGIRASPYCPDAVACPADIRTGRFPDRASAPHTVPELATPRRGSRSRRSRWRAPLYGRPSPGNLPEPLTSFVGREHEVSGVRHALAHARLVTLQGPAGIGKTRRALRVASEIATSSGPRSDGRSTAGTWTRLERAWKKAWPRDGNVECGQASRVPSAPLADWP